MRIVDVRAEPTIADRDEWAAAGVVAILAVPLVREGVVVAALTVRQASPRTWSDGDVDLLRALVDRVRVALERASAEQRRAESEALLAAFMENAPLGMHLKDANGRYLRMNPELGRQIGIVAEHVIGRMPQEFLPPDIEVRVRALEAEALAGRTATTEFHFAERADYAALVATVFPIVVPGGGMRTGGFTIDVTERRRAADALARSRETLYQSEKVSALGSLLAGVSHELNNPLSIVVAQAIMLERHVDGELAVRAAKLRAAADRCARIVQIFLTMARQKRPERSAVDLNAIVEGALDLTAYGLRTDGIAVVRDLARPLPTLLGDADQLHQIVVNLIVNAQQAMVSGDVGERRLSLRTRAVVDTGMLALEIADSGLGVPEPVRRRIFEPFYTTKPQGQGTGLGLSFSQGLAEAHGGRLDLVDSPRGACFRLTLPVGETSAVGTRSDAADVPACAVQRRALVIDDEPEIAESLADLLSLEGFDCEVAVGGGEAQRLLAAGRYDLIVSDLRMPGADGPRLYHWIASHRPDQLDRTVFSTGDTLGATAAHFLEIAGRPVLEKPFTPEAIAKVLAEIKRD